MSFFGNLADRIAAIDSRVSVGLDPDPDRLPPELGETDLPRWRFNRRVIDATHEHAACYKPNAAFYEDPDGWRALRETIAYAHGKDVPVLLDGKRADIGNTARRYADLLDHADAITVTPYMGRDSLAPFLDRTDKGVFVLCRTSNAGCADLQGRELADGEPLYRRVAALASAWNDAGNVGLVVGATAADELAELREAVPELPFLVPGVGAQGGDIPAAAAHAPAERPAWSVPVGLVNSSRSVIFAGEEAPSYRDRGDLDAYFAAAGEAAKRLRLRLAEA